MPKLSKFREEGQASQTMERLGVTKINLVCKVNTMAKDTSNHETL